MLFLEQRDVKAQSRKPMLLEPVLCFSYLEYFKSHASTRQLSLPGYLFLFFFVLIPARTELIFAVVKRGYSYRAWRLVYTNTPMPGAWERDCLPGRRGSIQLRKLQREPPGIVYYHLFSFCANCFIYLWLLIL